MVTYLQLLHTWAILLYLNCSDPMFSPWLNTCGVTMVTMVTYLRCYASYNASYIPRVNPGLKSQWEILSLLWEVRDISLWYGRGNLARTKRAMSKTSPQQHGVWGPRNFFNLMLSGAFLGISVWFFYQCLYKIPVVFVCKFNTSTWISACFYLTKSDT